MQELIKSIEEKLLSLLQNNDCLERDVIESMKYSLEAGGKRIRPLLCLLFCKLCGGTAKMALPFACSLEMVHTYSLIHDDLPCMDDDDMRRGRKSNHKVFGEDIALLAGDALQSLAFEVMSSEDAVKSVGAERCIKAVNTFSKRIGANGMVGGQVIDLKYENKNAGIEILREMDNKKTGALIACACELGCIVAGADDVTVLKAREYGETIGLAFQIMDDILDVTADEALFGKPVNSDSSNNKSTYVSLYGLQKCRELVSELTNKALNILDNFSTDSSELKKLTIELSERKK